MTVYRDVMKRLRRAAAEESLLLRVDAGAQSRPGWRHDRACHGLPVAMWFDKAPAELAESICRSCPVRLDCLITTLEVETTVGDFDHIYGLCAVRADTRRDWLRASATATVHPLVALIMQIEDEEAAQARDRRLVGV